MFGVPKAFLIRLTAGGLAALCVACESGTEPEREAAVRPELRYIELQRGRMRDGGILFVEMFTVDPHYRLGTNEYLPLVVTTDVGEREALRLKNEICSGPQGGNVICGFFTVQVNEGLDIRAIEDDLQRLGARLTFIATPRLGSAYAFGDWVRTMKAASGLPEVLAVDYVRLLAGTPDVPPFETLLAAAAPFALGVPIPNDGVVTATQSDTLTITYIQPEGTPLIYRAAPIQYVGRRGPSLPRVAHLQGEIS